MELDNKNIHRLLRLVLYDIRKNAKQHISYVYIVLYYTCLLNYLSNSIFNVVWPLKPFFSLFVVIFFYLLFLIINHIFIHKYIGHIVLLLIEILLFISIFMYIKMICLLL